MDRELLDRVSVELSARVSADAGANAEREMALLRDDGYSVVESAYVISKAFGISLIEAKVVAVKIESERDRWREVEDLHERMSES